MERLSLFRGNNLKLTDKVTVIHPTASDIESVGYAQYCEYVSALSSTSKDVADILWYDMNIWYEDIKDEWDFFLQKCISEFNEVSVRIYDKDTEGVFVEEKCVAVGSIYRDALNFFLGLSGEYIVLTQTIGGIEQTILLNVVPCKDNEGVFSFDDQSFKFTKFFYEQVSRFIDSINWTTRDYDYLKGGTKYAKKVILKEDHRKRNKKKKKSLVTFDSILSSLVAKGCSYNEIWGYPIYVIYDLYYRFYKIDEYSNTMQALHSGCIDTKKNPVNWDKINWSSVIN